MKGGFLLATKFSLENNLPTFGLNVSVIIRAKVNKCEQTPLLIAIHYYTMIHVIGGQRSVRIVPGRGQEILVKEPLHMSR